MDSNAKTSREQTTARGQGQRRPAVTAFNRCGAGPTRNGHIMESITANSPAATTRRQQQQDGNVILDSGDEVFKGTDTVARKLLGD